MQLRLEFMSGRTDLAITGQRSMRGSWALCVFFSLTTLQTVVGNQGSILGSCPCDQKLTESLDSTLWKLLTTYLRGYEHCRNYIRFRLPRRNLCASPQNTWVQELKSCFDNHECGFSRIDQTANQIKQDDYTTTRTQGSKPPGLDHLPPFTPTTHPSSQPNWSTRTQPRGMRDRYFSDTTSAPPENTSIINLKWRVEKGPVEQLGTSPIIPVLCLLAIVFVLTVALVCVLCLKRRARQSPKQHSKGKHGIQVFWSHKSQLQQGQREPALLGSTPFPVPDPSSQKLSIILKKVLDSESEEQGLNSATI
ncbi:C-X-C motif chemokine 16 isoform X2 [Monodelphis domestica]|uniref:C-X-C motif chemokine 16 isoform X2 n=1 Tax=Monodelphis domestica TaxID=13616 RepID=UPI0004436113|nr:C-X-C motif chemokine 16 isoform X2 [Monodelphis domestica]